MKVKELENMSREKVYRAAMIPFFMEKDGSVTMKFMIPSDQQYGGSDPQLCKGKIEPNESAEEASLREAEEEVGLVLDNIEWLLHLGNFLGRTEVFVCKVYDKDNFIEPHFETEEAMWLTPQEFMEQGRELHRPVVRTALQAILDINSEDDEPADEEEL